MCVCMCIYMYMYKNNFYCKIAWNFWLDLLLFCPVYITEIILVYFL